MINDSHMSHSYCKMNINYCTLMFFFTASADYVSVSQNLVFVAGDTEECVLITLLDDDVQEDNETFLVTITAVDPALQIFQLSTVVTIQDMGRYQHNSYVICGFL